MIVCKKTFITPPAIACLLGLLSVLSCLPFAYAQQSTKDEGQSDTRHIGRLDEAGVDEWEMDLALPAAAPVAPASTGIASMPDVAQNAELQRLLSSLAADPSDSGVLAQLSALLADVVAQANALMDISSIDEAEKLLAIVQPIDPNLRGLKTAQKHLLILREANDLAETGNAALQAQRLIEHGNDNALYYYNQALVQDPKNRLAHLGLQRVQEELILRANDSAQELDFELAAEWLQEASAVREDQSLVDEAKAQLEAFENMRADDLEKEVMEAMDAGQFSLADFTIIDLIALGGHEDRVQYLRAQLKEVRFYGGFQPGQVISDKFLESDHTAPDIVVIPSGSFLMGSGGNSGGAYDNEQPRHRVTIARGFGLGAREVTVAEFGLFIERSGYRTAAQRAGASTIYDEAAGRLSKRRGIDWEYDYSGKKAQANEPVLHVNLYDARAYVQWLVDETGKRYRLPSEAEYEYAARAAANGTYWWGEGSPGKVVENLTGSRDNSDSKRRWTTPFKKYGDGYWGPAPAGSLEDNELIHPMGIYDIAGNVSEWVEDCWHPNYVKAPVNGSAWVNPGCKRTVVRGGYWASAPEQSRAAFRISAKPETLGPVVGIRIARDL